jgi:NAD(P)-dependent dehydrogenase (short-subunit alcohol dehydrogenase family)
LACRNLDKANAAAQEIEDLIASKTSSSVKNNAREKANKIHVFELDTSSFVSVNTFAEALKGYHTSAGSLFKIDYLYHNAGISGTKPGIFSPDGFDLTYQTNFLSSFLLTHLLLSRDALTPDARIVFTTSTGQYGGKFSSEFSSTGRKNVFEKGYHCPPMSKTPSPSQIYSNTKSMQVAFAKLLQQHLRSIGSEVSAHAFTPDYCSTPIFSKVESLGGVTLASDPLFYALIALETVVAIPVEEGAATGVWLADAEIKKKELGSYWDRCSRLISGADMLSEGVLKKLWGRWCDDAEVKWDLMGKSD